MNSSFLTPEQRNQLDQYAQELPQPYQRRARLLLLYDTGLPTLLWTRRTERRGPLFSTTVDVHPLLLPGPLPLQIAVSTGGGREERSVTLSPAGGSWTFETADKPSEVEINGNRGLLADVKQVRRLPPPQR